MDKASVKGLVLSVIIGLFFFLTFLFFYINDQPPSRLLTCEATYVEKKAHFVSSHTGTHAVIFLCFKLGSEDVVFLRDLPGVGTLAPGDRVRIYYHKGRFLKNLRYDFYESINGKNSPRVDIGSDYPQP